MTNAKITDLRREVKKRLTKKGVVDLTEFRLKSIDTIENNNKKIRSALDRNLKKIGKTLIDNINKLDISEEEKLNKLSELLVGDISTTIKTTNDEEVKGIVKSFSKGKTSEIERYFAVEVKEGDTKLSSYSTLHYEIPKSKEGFFKLRYNGSGNYLPFANFKKIIGTIYFFNKLREYIKKNKKMTTLIYLKYIQLEGIYKNEEYKEMIDELAKEYNLPVIKVPKVYLKDFITHRTSFEKLNKSFEYLSWIEKNNYFNLDDIFEYNKRLNANLLYSIKNEKLVAHFLNHIHDLNAEEEQEVKEEIKLSSDYARSYETKKNIPQKVLNKMKTTKFKNYFGYVEFDELVDLDKLEIIEKEWIDINKKILFPVVKNHSLRFRRLGKHKASGLYFSGANAICVDLGGPSSLIHELMHMIDYTILPNTTLSSMFNFRGIVERYRDVANSKVLSMEENSSFKKAWNGKSKYNKSYYLSVKEIFARCGELYINYILGITSSLVDTSNEILYPKGDGFLLELIEKYYSSIIQLTPENKEEYKTASINEINYNSDPFELFSIISEAEQITLFEI